MFCAFQSRRGRKAARLSCLLRTAWTERKFASLIFPPLNRQGASAPCSQAHVRRFAGTSGLLCKMRFTIIEKKPGESRAFLIPRRVGRLAGILDPIKVRRTLEIHSAHAAHAAAAPCEHGG